MLTHYSMDLIYLGSILVMDDFSYFNEDSANTAIDSSLIKGELGGSAQSVTVEVSATGIFVRKGEEVMEILGLNSLEFTYSYFDGEIDNVVFVNRAFRTLSARSIHVFRAPNRLQAVNIVAAISTAYSKLLR
ncbi:hypothetical protein PENTCL1PPCAC_17442 [Pristionchus entomophagus]|uniref:Uncharacterized protein n=1 Tax=Pristionchus entomophagus TaxID=358040 RepID=A0AAV5TM68_9BILA|nr:hypothetical protein PENTCL1PPCAC_17442 [Pristionchus entomophagus]